MCNNSRSISDRLKELFADETDVVTASKLHMTQGNLNKIKNGRQALTVDNLRLISETYHVSADWILGLKEGRAINDIDLDRLDYSQVFVLIDKLYENKTIEPASSTETIKTSDSYDEVDSEEVQDDSQQISTVGIDYDLIRINDPALSFMLRRRVKLIEVDFNIFNDWKEKHLKDYKGIPLLLCDEEMRDYLLNHCSGKTEGDLIETLKNYINLLSKNKGENK
ncbi:helix-turn-helix domain-containing protein [Megasphaera elsdenii]|jgi:transcriptional regulator with XRE-family HTH domain|uniref:helix-turn-helix domain-containing protein n=1 Tax=Megasphaera elsdenii TaxID=907 RepID=UPI001D030278|nr:helix-turn-helix transcriptional regulator [Megasphaera elsdenii]MCB5702353.1 helix-turn-helix domain-containing protein [Megasphaera elsdenii]MCB5727136.1 helix-turn-helix domain-containing protein [Megasphaera elsdenii]MCB5770915.1 helix-turn-helix domain-containing protein [Megasphaera elsdenii]